MSHSHENQDPHARFPAHHPSYNWEYSPEEAALSDALSEAARWGDTHSYGGVAHLALENIVQPEAVQPDTKRLMAFETFQSHDHRLLTDDFPEIGLSMSISQRERYKEDPSGETPPVEPTRLSIGMSESPATPGVAVEIVVPSRAFTRYATDADYPRSADESRPPHARIRIDEGADVKQLLSNARISLATSDKSQKPEGFEGFGIQVLKNTAALFGALGVDKLPANQQGQRSTEVTLTPDMMNQASLWANYYFSSHGFDT